MKNEGYSLLEVLVAASMMTVSGLAMTSLIANNLKSSNFLEFQLKKQQLRVALLSQILTNPDHCKCMFSGAAEFATPGPSDLTGYTAPTSLGRYQPADCSGGIPNPRITNAGLDGMRLTGVHLRNVSFAAGTYAGDLVVDIESQKDVLGPKALSFSVPVLVNTSPGSSGHVVFQSCTVAEQTPSERLQGVTVGSPIVDSFSGNNITHSNTYMLSSYPDAVAVSYQCALQCRDSAGIDHVLLTFQNGGTDLFSATACKTAPINGSNTAFDARSGVIPIPTAADRVLVEKRIQGCDNGTPTNDSTIRFLQ